MLYFYPKDNTPAAPPKARISATATRNSSAWAPCDAFGVMKDKNLYGRKVRGIERSTFVIDEKGRLARAWRGVKVPGHAEEVLNFVKAL